MAANVNIIISATDKASGVLKGVAGTLGSIAKAATLVGGAALAGFGITAKSALDATADYEKLTMQLNTLAARELIHADSTLTMADAYKQATSQTQELLKWTQELGIHSPFDQKTIANSLQQAMNYGFTADEAKRLTQNLVDMGAGMGFTADKMDLVSYALGQIHSSDKLLTQDLRQLISAGVPVNDILGKMGFTLADVGKEAISSADFLEEFNKMTETDFAGAGDRMTKTWGGMLSTFSDIKNMGLRTLFAETFAVLQPLVSLLQDWILGPGLAKLEDWGKAMGNLTQNVVDLFTGTKKLDFSDMTASFSAWAESIDWAGLSTQLANGIKSMDWNAVGIEIRTGFINIFNALNTIVSEINWQALAEAFGHALAEVIAGLYGYVSWESLTIDFNNGFASLFGYVGANAFEQFKTDLREGFVLVGQIFMQGLSIAASIVMTMRTVITNIFSGMVTTIVGVFGILLKVVETQLANITRVFETKGNSWVVKAAQALLNAIPIIVNAVSAMMSAILAAIVPIHIPISVAGLGGNTSGSGTGGGGTGGGGNTSGSSMSPSSQSNGVPQLAGGGIVSGPTTGHLAMLHGTEGVFTREQMAMLSPAGGNSNGITINLTYAPAFSTADAAELETNLMPLILRGIHQARRAA